MSSDITIQAAGTNHRYASIESRERLGRPPAEGESALSYAAGLLNTDDCILLRTCNRVEVYFTAPLEPSRLPRVREFFGWLAGSDHPSDEIYSFAGRDAARHLFDVSCGLDSMILGEYEILGQVRAALSEALEAESTGPVLARLFQHAVRTGKRARTETGISSGIFSVGQCAVRLAERALDDLQGKRVLVFGSGKIARSTAKHFAASCSTRFTIFSRTPAHAQQLAADLGGTSISSERLPQAFGGSDIIIGCTSAPHHVIGVAELREAMEARRGRPIVVIDLGVPRNVDPGVGSLPGVHLFNLDHLEAVVSENAKAREAEVRKVRAIIDEELACVLFPDARRRVTKLIRGLRARAETKRREVIHGACGGGSAEADAELLDRATDLLVRKLLHDPIVALRNAAVSPDSDRLASTIARIFGLDESDASADEEPPSDSTSQVAQGAVRE